MNKKLINWWAGTSFSPLNLSNLLMWYDVNDSATLTIDGSNRVSQMTDKSGNGYTVSNGGAATTWPVYTANAQNGKPVLTYTSSQLLSRAKVTALQGIGGLTVFIIGGGGGADRFYHGQDASNRTEFVVNYTSNTLFAVVSNAGTQYGSVATSNANHKGAFIFDGSQTGNANRMKARVDGAAVTLSFTGTIPATTESGASSILSIGGANNGRLGEVLVYTRALTSGEISQVESYLLTKWNL